MSLSPEQREARKKFLGASEVSAVLGLDPYRSAADVWLEKTGQCEPFEGNEATERGNLLEPAILTFAESEIGKFFYRDQMEVANNGLLAANFDGLDPDGNFAVEAKSSRVPGDYGDPGTDQVPDKVIAQTHAQMLVAGPQCKLVYVPIITVGLEFRMYVVPRDEDLIGKIETAGTSFMRDYVRKGIRPTDWKPSLEVLKRVRREPKTLIEVPATVIDKFLEAKEALKIAKEYEESAKAELLSAMQTAEACIDENRRVITYFEQSNKGYTVQPFTCRVLRPRKNRSNNESYSAGFRSTMESLPNIHVDETGDRGMDRPDREFCVL